MQDFLSRWGKEQRDEAFELCHGVWPQISDSLSPFTCCPLSPGETRHGALTWPEYQPDTESAKRWAEEMVGLKMVFQKTLIEK